MRTDYLVVIVNNRRVSWTNLAHNGYGRKTRNEFHDLEFLSGKYIYVEESNKGILQVATVSGDLGISVSSFGTDLESLEVIQESFR